MNSGYMYLFAAIFLAAASQFLFRLETLSLDTLPDQLHEKIIFLIKLVITSPLLFLGMCLTFLGGIFWLLALTKFELSYAYPFTGLAFILILSLDIVFFGANLNFSKVIGTLIVFAGLVVLSR